MLARVCLARRDTGSRLQSTHNSSVKHRCKNVQKRIKNVKKRKNRDKNNKRL